jgi:hypothetical protein
MHTFLCHLLLISMLFVSIEGAADMGKSGHVHDEHANFHADPEGSGSDVADIDADHCDHCCHGHLAGISPAANSNQCQILTDNDHPRRSSFVKNYAQAPPTPPPNA